eukprot:3915877-Pleurochrysis_carterae.AAC.2
MFRCGWSEGGRVKWGEGKDRRIERETGGRRKRRGQRERGSHRESRRLDQGVRSRACASACTRAVRASQQRSGRGEHELLAGYSANLRETLCGRAEHARVRRRKCMKEQGREMAARVFRCISNVLIERDQSSARNAGQCFGSPVRAGHTERAQDVWRAHKASA